MRIYLLLKQFVLGTQVVISGTLQFHIYVLVLIILLKQVQEHIKHEVNEYPSDFHHEHDRSEINMRKDELLDIGQPQHDNQSEK
ncbi:hypothetical protein D3C85_1049320 [compost metagenome]